MKMCIRDSVSTIYKDRQGDLWISGNKELWCIDLDDQGDIKTWYRLKSECESPVHAILDIGWTVCAGIDNQVYRVEKQPDHLLKADILSDSLVSFSEDWRISCMQADGDALWIGSNRGLFRYNPVSYTHLFNICDLHDTLSCRCDRNALSIHSEQCQSVDHRREYPFPGVRSFVLIAQVCIWGCGNR